MIKFYFAIILFFGFYTVEAQFPPAAGQYGSTAINTDSTLIIAWATNCIVDRGYVNISDTNFLAGGSNKASYGNAIDAIGKANNNVVSLGDGGEAVLTFEFPIVNGQGWDFVVFENALNDTFLELAFVEVSSNGIDFFRFPAASLTQTDVQTSSFGSTDPENLNNLAGKYRVLYGTPFDIDDIDDHLLLNKNSITYVKIIDVIGSINQIYASYDSFGNVINDPFTTPFESCGFDLDAVGVINNTQTIIEDRNNNFTLYPNPVNDLVCLPFDYNEIVNFKLFDSYGRQIEVTELINNCIYVSNLSRGIYFFRIESIYKGVINASFLKL